MVDRYRPYLIIVFFGLLLYSAVAFFNFSYLDDHVLLLDNYSIIHDVSNIGRIFTDDVFFSFNNFYYRPILNISFLLDSFISGNLPWFFHLVNIFWHILAASLIFNLLIKLKSPRFLSLFLSLLFLFHPALVQAVAWIPGRNDSILTVFIIGSFLCFLKFLEKSRPIDYLLYLFLFLLALFTKEAAVILPILLIFYYLFIFPGKLILADRLMLFFGTFGVIFIWFIFRSLAITGGNLTIYNILISIFNNSSTFIIGLGRFFFPFDLAIMSVIKDAHLIYGLLAIIILAAAFVYKKGVNKEYFVFGLLWFLLFFLPSLINPEPSSISYFLEHRLYLPFIGLLIIISQVKVWQEINYKRPLVYLMFLFFLVLFFSLAANHLPDFKDRLSFWQSAVTSSPSSPMAHRNLGAMLYLEGRGEEAIIQYQLALAVNAFEPMAHNNIGLIYLERGDLKAAEQEFKLELAINPGYDKALANLERLLILQNRLR